MINIHIEIAISLDLFLLLIWCFFSYPFTNPSKAEQFLLKCKKFNLKTVVDEAVRQQIYSK